MAQNTKKKIFWIAHEGIRSGANNALLDYAEILNKGEYDVTIIVPYEGNMVDECVKRGLKSKLFYYTWTVYYRKSIDYKVWLRRRMRNAVTFFQFYKYIIKEKPDFIITNSIVATPLFALAAKFFGTRHIWFIQEFGNLDHGFKFDFGYPFTVKTINGLSSKVIVVADAIGKHLSNYTSPDKFVTVFNRVSVPQQYRATGPGSGRQPFKILHLSQVGPTKNQKEGIAAINILKQQGLNVHLEIVGANLNERYYEELKQYIRDNDLQSHVTLTGFSKEPYEKIRQANAVILCSRCEACALTIFETLQIGTPIIVSHTGGNAEIVKQGETGLIYQYSNPQDLAEKIKMLYEDEELYSRLSKNAIKYSQINYSIDKSIEQIKQVLEAV